MDKKSLRLKREFEEIIKNGAGLVMEETELIEPISDEDMQRLGMDLPPNDMYDRIIREVRKNKHIGKRGIRKILIIAAIVSILACGSGAMAFKLFGSDLFATYGKRSIYLTESGIEAENYDGSEKEAFSDAEKKLGKKLLKPGYMPKGFYLQAVDVEPEYYVEFTYVNSENSSVRIQQTLRDENSLMSAIIDSAEIKSSVMMIGKYEINFAEYVRDGTDEWWTQAFWHDDELDYELTSNISRDEVEKIIQKME